MNETLIAPFARGDLEGVSNHSHKLGAAVRRGYGVEVRVDRNLSRGLSGITFADLERYVIVFSVQPSAIALLRIAWNLT